MFRTIVAAGAMAALVSCGGGGEGGGGGATSISFGVASLAATAFQNQKADVNAFQDATVTVDASASGNLSGVVYVVVQDAGSGFGGSPIQVSTTAAGYRATLKPNASLPAGTYAGNLILHLCKDAGCTQEYPVSGGSLPYQVIILPQLRANVLVNGSAAGSVQSGRNALALSLADGTRLEVQSNVPMQMMYSSGPGFVGVTVDPTSTSTNWKAVVARPAFPTTRQLTLAVVPKDATVNVQMSANLDVTMVP